MFDDVRDLWRRYTAAHAPEWDKGDPRYDLAAEVLKRLGWLNLVLTHLERALRTIQRVPDEDRRVFTWMKDNPPKLESGEMTGDESAARWPRSIMTQKELAAWQTAWDEIELFTETFYFVAWRMMVVLNQRGPYMLPGVRVKARGVRDVRNHLLEHPENHGQNFAQRFVITSEGPVLKNMAVIARHSTGRVEPDRDSVDRGLYANARELHDELAAALGAALA